VLLGIVPTLTGRHGTLVIETDDQNVQVAVKRESELVRIVNAGSGWEIRLESGRYELEMEGSEDQFELDRDTVTVKPRDCDKVSDPSAFRTVI